VALAIGTTELVQVTTGRLEGLDVGTLGYGIVGLFVLAWMVSYGFWKARRSEERWAYASLEDG
jgi:high-affinity nickel-transport protein